MEKTIKYLKAARLFLGIVFRDWHGQRIGPRTAWEVSKLIWLN